MSSDATRVLFLTTSFPLYAEHWSGVFVYRQALAISKCGCSVTVLAPGAPGAATRETIGPLRIERFRYLPERAQQIAYGGGIPANLKNKPWLWLGVPAFGLSLIRAASRLARDHDLLHAHWSFAGALASLKQVRREKPLAVSFHGSDLARADGPYATFARRAARAANLVVVHSDDMHRRASEIGVPGAKILQLPHGVDAGEFTPRKSADGPFRLAAVGRLSSEKGFDLLLRAMSRIETDVEWRLEIAGEGPLRSELQSMTEALGLQKRVIWRGALRQSDVKKVLEDADLLLIPSYREGFNVVALESMAAATPILGTRVGALPDLVTEAETGWLVEPGDEEGLARAVERSLADRAACHRMGRLGRDRLQKHYSLVTVNEPLVAAYRGLLES
ncbi:MAG: glycosyltransferase family 4 protein [Candidatus Lernaella stagnicola]|nr:glycosyltransferase family 4 protein [Candidatus Lernaella stagnicola]